METLTPLLYALLSGIAAAIFHAILIAPGKIGADIRIQLERFVMWVAEKSKYGRAWRIVTWITKSAIDCAWCLGGQLGLFTYLWHGGRDPVDAFLYLCLSIMVTKVAFQYLSNDQDQSA